MQPEALLYSITATNSSFTRNLKGMIPAMRMQSLDHGRKDTPHSRASGFACDADVPRETRMSATTRPLLMRVAPRTRCEGRVNAS